MAKDINRIKVVLVEQKRTGKWLRSSSARLLPSGRKNYHRIIHKNNPIKREKNRTSSCSSERED